MSLKAQSHQEEDVTQETFEEWTEAMISEFADLVASLRDEVAMLRKRVVGLEQSAGPSLLHPSDLLEQRN